jgi:hypothetical protein
MKSYLNCQSLAIVNRSRVFEILTKVFQKFKKGLHAIFVVFILCGNSSAQNIKLQPVVQLQIAENIGQFRSCKTQW